MSNCQGDLDGHNKGKRCNWYTSPEGTYCTHCFAWEGEDDGWMSDFHTKAFYEISPLRTHKHISVTDLKELKKKKSKSRQGSADSVASTASTDSIGDIGTSASSASLASIVTTSSGASSSRTHSSPLVSPTSISFQRRPDPKT